MTYNPSRKQLLVLLPPYVASTQKYARLDDNPTGLPLSEFSTTTADPPSCTVGFLRPSQWRSPEETTTVDTPDGLYSKLPQDLPIAVRGARNYPCMGHPGKRAFTAQICDGDKACEQSAMRQHAFGPYPLDPNLISHGILPDVRITIDNRIFGPVEGTPPPAGASPHPAGPPPSPEPRQAPNPTGDPHSATDTPPPARANPAALAAAPSALNRAKSGLPGALARYYRHTGEYLAHDGKCYQQSDLVTATTPKSWQDVEPHG